MLRPANQIRLRDSAPPSPKPFPVWLAAKARPAQRGSCWNGTLPRGGFLHEAVFDLAPTAMLCEGPLGECHIALILGARFEGRGCAARFRRAARTASWCAGPVYGSWTLC